jgi:hypothetical protein
MGAGPPQLQNTSLSQPRPDEGRAEGEKLDCAMRTGGVSIEAPALARALLRASMGLRPSRPPRLELPPVLGPLLGPQTATSAAATSRIGGRPLTFAAQQRSMIVRMDAGMSAGSVPSVGRSGSCASQMSRGKSMTKSRSAG